MYPGGYTQLKESAMCSKATCRKCGKITWSGCGKHVKQVMRGVPADRQCICGAQTQKASAAAQSAATAKRSRFSSLFRR